MAIKLALWPEITFPSQSITKPIQFHKQIGLNLIYGFAGVLALSFLVCVFKFPDLDWGVHGNVISDFGAYHGTASIFNTALVIGGILNLGFIISALGALNIKWNTPSGLALITGAVFLSLIGLAPLPNDNNLFSLPRIIHWAFATTYFLAEPLGITLLGWRVRERQPRFAKWSLALSLVVVIATLGNVLLLSKILAEISHTVLVALWKIRLGHLAKSHIHQANSISAQDNPFTASSWLNNWFAFARCR